MTPRLARIALILSAVLATVGCGPPRIRIERSQPPVFQLPTSQKLALVVETDGTPPSATTVLDTALGFTRGQVLNKWLAVEPVRNEWTAQLAGAQYQLVPQAQADVVLRVRPVDWSYGLNLKKITSGSGRIDLRVEILSARDAGAPRLYAETYWATGEADTLGEPEAMARAARSAAARFLQDLRPSRVWNTVEMDDSDPVVKPGIELCKEGHFDAAFAAFADATTRQPSSAPAWYNLGVLAESRGQYDEAEAALLQATRLAPKPIYFKALERVRAARRDWQALQQAQ